jgi:hypothetical protein
MNYLELFVYRPSGAGNRCERAIATVLANGRDLFDSLERSVFELGKSGWAVDDVKAFKTEFELEFTAGRERLRHMMNRARDEGIDWTIEPVAATAAPVASPASA